MARLSGLLNKVAAVHARYSVFLLVGLLASFLAARIVILSGGTVFTGNDSFSYAYRGDSFYDRGPLVSLIGESPRLWGVPLLYAMFGTDQARVVAQWGIGTVAWAVLAWGAWGCLRGTVARCLAAGLVLLLGLTPAVASWDFAILSESLSINLGILTLGLLLRWSATRSWLALAGMTLSAFWWTFTRAEIRLLIVALVLGLVATALWQRADRRALAASVAALLVAVGWCTAILPTVSTTFAGWSATGLSADEELMAYRMRFQVLPEPKTKALFQREFGLPPCPAAERVVAGKEWAIREFVAAYDTCPEFAAWTREYAGQAYRYPLADPALFASHVRRWSARSVQGAVYAKAVHVLPTKAEQLAFPPRDHVVGLLALGLLASLAGAVALGAVRRRKALLWTGAVTAAVSVASLVAGITMAAGEYARFGLQEGIGLRVAIVLLAAASLDIAVERFWPVVARRFGWAPVSARADRSAAETDAQAAA